MESIASDQKKERNRKKMYNWTSVSSVSLTPAEELTLLANNNTGLCRYIECVRQVDFLIFCSIYFIIRSFLFQITGQNRKLVTVVETLEESRVKESEDIEQMYKDKLDELKNQKETLEKDLEKLLNETDVLKMLNSDLKNKNDARNTQKDVQESLRQRLISEKKSLLENIVKAKNDLDSKTTLL